MQKNIMKRIIFLALISLISFTSFSQVNYNQKITAKYAEISEIDYLKDEYIITNSGWETVIIEPYETHYIYYYEGEKRKVWWEYLNYDDDLEGDLYYTEDGREVIFCYDEQRILFYSKYNERTDTYEQLIELSRLEVEDK